MKKILSAAVALLFSAGLASASITLTLDIGVLRTSSGIPVNSSALFQLLVSSTDSFFTAPTPTSFVGGSLDDVILYSGTMNEIVGPGTSEDLITTITLTGDITANDPLLLRWWPTLTGSSSMPGYSTPYGQFRSDSSRSAYDIAWFLPNDGSTSVLQFLTQSVDGNQPDTAGNASYTTAAAAIPEPSSFAFCAVGLLGLALKRRRGSLSGSAR